MHNYIFDKRTISLVAYDNNNSVVAIFKNMPKVYNFILEFDYVYLSDERNLFKTDRY